MKLKNVKTLSNSLGYTLIELMIIAAVLGILAAVAIPNFISYRDKSYCIAAESDAKAIIASLADYFSYPTHTSIGELPAVIDNNGDLLDGKGPVGLKFNKLSASGYGNIAQLDGNLSKIKINILDASDRCPQDYINSSNGKWTNSPFPSNPIVIPASFLFGKQYHEQYQ